MKNHRPTTLRTFFASIVVLATMVVAPLLVTRRADARPTEEPLRVAVIGASASAGFGCVHHEKREDGEYAGSFRLIDMVKCACPEMKLVVSDLSSGFFFLSPIENGTAAATRAQAFKPDCVIALDFLFWYAYGSDAPGGGAITAEDQRLAKFELGLKELDGFSGAIIVGDLPDMSAAIGKMLNANQVPAAATLKSVNARLNEWAKTHPRVTVLSLSRMQRELMEENALHVRDTRLVGTKENPLLQRDALHPTALGLAGLACVVTDALKVAVKRESDGCTPEPDATMSRACAGMKRSAQPRPSEAPPAPPTSAPTPPVPAPPSAPVGR